VVTTLGEVNMHEIVLDVQNDGLAYVLACKVGEEPTRLASVYRMKDGWHTKLASDHTRHAWSGPFDSAEDALAALQATMSSPA
jgi:hypothetical protein